MELSPKLLTEIEFKEQWRGYSPSEVDEFLERVAAAVAELQQRLTESLERASNAERRLLERTDEDEIRRTLVLAQRTAVAAMEEARADADRMVSETDARCRQLVADAEAEAERLDAEIATRRRTELGALADQRAALELDIGNLRQFVETEQARLADLLRSQLGSLEQDFTVAEPPPMSELPHIPAPSESRPQSGVDSDVAVEAVAPDWDELALATADQQDEVADDDVANEVDPSVDELRRAREELADALRTAGVDPARSPDSAARPDLFDDRSDEETGSYDTLWESSGAATDDEAAAEKEEPRWRDDEEDDPFLAELRRAVIDPEPLGPREHRPVDEVDADDEDRDVSGGFFRRGRRRD